ncbi:MAG: hypothetical protein IJY80_01205 [Opitutales bacterium]|nr:hypothetical protein [Opitutales bacterium]
MRTYPEDVIKIADYIAAIEGAGRHRHEMQLRAIAKELEELVEIQNDRDLLHNLRAENEWLNKRLNDYVAKNHELEKLTRHLRRKLFEALQAAENHGLRKS